MPLVYKLFFLAVRQVSKPVAAAVKRIAESSELSSQVLTTTGQGIHRMQIQVSRAADGKLQLSRIAPLKADAAREVGANLLSELVIYSIATSTIVYEYRMGKIAEAKKATAKAEAEAKRREENRQNEDRQWEEFRHLQRRITMLQEELQEVRQRTEAHEQEQQQQRQQQQRTWQWWLWQRER